MNRLTCFTAAATLVTVTGGCAEARLGPAESELASNGMLLVSVREYHGHEPRFAADGIEEAPSPMEQLPGRGPAATSSDRPSDALETSALDTRGGVTAYLVDWDVMKLTDGRTERVIDFPRGTAGKLNADGSFWTKSIGDGTNRWTRHTLAGESESIDDLGEVIFFDAMGDTLLVGHKNATGARIVEVVVR